MDLMEVMKENRIIMPHGLTMLARGLTHMEGVLADIAPEINMVEIAAGRIKANIVKNFDWKKELKSGGKTLYRAVQRALDIPVLVSDAVQGYLKGQTKVNLDLHASPELARLLRRMVQNIVMGLWVMALLISSSIICTTDMRPKIWGIPALGAFGYLIAFVIVMYVFLKHLFSKKIEIRRILSPAVSLFLVQGFLSLGFTAFLSSPVGSLPLDQERTLLMIGMSRRAVRDARTQRRKSPDAVSIKQLKITTLHGTGVSST